MAQQIQGIWVKETKAVSGYASTQKPQACGLCSQKQKDMKTPQILKREHTPHSLSGCFRVKVDESYHSFTGEIPKINFLHFAWRDKLVSV